MQVGNISHMASAMISDALSKAASLQFPNCYEVACSHGAASGTGLPSVSRLASWKVSHPVEGTALIDLGGRYELRMSRQDGSVVLRNQVNGEEQRLWGDRQDQPANGSQARSYRLLDGTKITFSFDTTDASGIEGPFLREINITRGERAIQIRGLETTAASELEIEKSEIGGRLLDWAIEDGQLFQQCGSGNGWLESCGPGSECQVAAASSSLLLDGLLSRMLGLFLSTGLLVHRQDGDDGAATATLIQAGDANASIAVNQREDGGLDVTANGEIISLDQEASQQLVIRVPGGDDQIFMDEGVTVQVQVESNMDDEGVQVDGETKNRVDGGDGIDDSVAIDDFTVPDLDALRTQLSSVQQEHLDTLETAMTAVDPDQVLEVFVSQAIRSEPGQGVHDSQIEALVYQSEVELNWSGVYHLDECVIMLLDDGWAYLDLGLAPEDFNVTASRQLEPGKWTLWREQEGGYELLDAEGDRWMALEGNVVLPADSGLSLGCQVSRSDVSGFPLMGMVTTHSNGFAFFEDGRFEAYSSSLSTTEGIGSFQSFYSHRDSKGNSSSISGNLDTTFGGLPGVVVSGHSESLDEGSDWRGSYQIEGNVIEFHYDSGRISRELFFVEGDGDLYIDDRIYWRKK